MYHLIALPITLKALSLASEAYLLQKVIDDKLGSTNVLEITGDKLSSNIVVVDNPIGHPTAVGLEEDLNTLFADIKEFSI